MPKKLVWTDAQDTTIRRLRAEGATWDAIAALLRLTRWTVIERGRQIGARPPPPDFIPPPDDPNRDVMPAGHPISWDALVRGTSLEGLRYRSVEAAV
jgi:hypothetical protein